MDTTNTTIIIPSACRKNRRVEILKAIESILSSEGALPIITFIANGPNVDPDIFEHVSSLPRVKAFLLDEPSATNAVRYGVQNCVDTPFFGFLDDDDYLLPGTIAGREDALNKHPEYDVVIGRALRRQKGKISSHMTFEQIQRCKNDPLGVMYGEGINWMTSSAGLFRKSGFDNRLFDDPTQYFEWTYLATKMVVKGMKVGFLEIEDHVIVDDLPANGADSLSRSQDYKDYEAKFLAAVKSLPLNKQQAHHIQFREATYYHTLSDELREKGEVGAALKAHLKSLTSIVGIKSYLLSTRKFVI